MHVAPLPCRVVEEAVAAEFVARLSGYVGVGVESVELEELVGSVAEDVACRSLQVLNGCRSATEDKHGVRLQIVAADEQRHLGLLAIGEDVVRLLCPEIAVYVVYNNATSASLLHKFLSRHGAQLL